MAENDDVGLPGQEASSDIFICGNCKVTFCRLDAFLAHKSDCKASEKTRYGCLLCDAVFSRKVVIQRHYGRKHRVVVTPRTQYLVEQDDDDSEVIQEAGIPSAITSHASEMKTTERDVGNENIAAFTTISNSAVADSPVISGGKEKRDPPLKDFTFLLVTKTIKGNSFNYGKSSFNCIHCKYYSYSKTALENHMRNYHRELADVIFAYIPGATDQQLGPDRQLMQMSDYNMRIRSKRGKIKKRIRNTEKQDIIGSYPCKTCDKVFSRLRYLRKHQQIHNTTKDFVCEVCGKVYRSQGYLTIHKKIHKKGKDFACSQCDFTSNINSAIHAHRQIHTEGSVLCDICGTAYTDKSTLSKHKRVHDPSRPYTCNFPGCTWRFKTEMMCKAHIRAHTTEGKFKCSVCGVSFRHKHHVQRHEKTLHGIEHATSSRSQNKEDPLIETSEEVVSVVVGGELPGMSDDIHFRSLPQQLVVATDAQGTPIAIEATDLPALNLAYQTYLQSTGESMKPLEFSILDCSMTQDTIQ